MNRITFRLAVLVLTLVLANHAASAEVAVRRFEASTTGVLTIEADGSVSAVELPETLQPPFRDAYLAAIRRWRFEPVRRDGVPVRAIGHMALQLYLETDGANELRAGFERVTFIDPPDAGNQKRRTFRLRSTPPQSLVRAGIGGEVDVVLERDEDGKVERAAARRGALYTTDHAPTPAAVRAMAQLATAAVEAARRMPGEVSPGERVVVVPVSFSFGTRAPAFWRPVLEVPLEAPAWTLVADSAQWLTLAGESPSAVIRPLQSVEGVEVLRTAGSAEAGG